MAKFRKKPVVIEAVQYDGVNIDEILDFSGTACHWKEAEGESGESLSINTLEGNMRVSDGDWIIKGVNGEFYPCNPDIFEKTYDYEEPTCLPDDKYDCATNAAGLIV